MSFLVIFGVVCLSFRRDLEVLAGRLRELLVSRGARRVSRRLSEDGLLVTAEFVEDVILIGISRGSFGAKYVAKLVPSSKVPDIPWELSYLEYVPHGLYVIAKNEEELLKGLERKIEILRRSVKPT